MADVSIWNGSDISLQAREPGDWQSTRGPAVTWAAWHRGAVWRGSGAVRGSTPTAQSLPHVNVVLDSCGSTPCTSGLSPLEAASLLPLLMAARVWQVPAVYQALSSGLHLCYCVDFARQSHQVLSASPLEEPAPCLASLSPQAGRAPHRLQLCPPWLGTEHGKQSQLCPTWGPRRCPVGSEPCLSLPVPRDFLWEQHAGCSVLW